MWAGGDVSRQPTMRLSSSREPDSCVAYARSIGTTQAPQNLGVYVADKSPRQSMSKKSGKSLKDKRADKRARGAHSSSTTDVLHNQKH